MTLRYYLVVVKSMIYLIGTSFSSVIIKLNTASFDTSFLFSKTMAPFQTHCLIFGPTAELLRMRSGEKDLTVPPVEGDDPT